MNFKVFFTNFKTLNLIFLLLLLLSHYIHQPYLRTKKSSSPRLFEVKSSWAFLLLLEWKKLLRLNYSLSAHKAITMESFRCFFLLFVITRPNYIQWLSDDSAVNLSLILSQVVMLQIYFFKKLFPWKPLYRKIQFDVEIAKIYVNLIVAFFSFPDGCQKPR